MSLDMRILLYMTRIKHKFFTNGFVNNTPPHIRLTHVYNSIIEQYGIPPAIPLAVLSRYIHNNLPELLDYWGDSVFWYEHTTTLEICAIRCLYLRQIENNLDLSFQ